MYLFLRMVYTIEASDPEKEKKEGSWCLDPSCASNLTWNLPPKRIRSMSQTPTTATSPQVLQYTSNVCGSAFGAPEPGRKGNLVSTPLIFIAVRLPFVSPCFQGHLVRASLRWQGDREGPKRRFSRRQPQIFADSPLLLETRAFGGRRKPQKTTDFRRKPKIFAENRRLGSVTLGASPLARPYLGARWYWNGPQYHPAKKDGMLTKSLWTCNFFQMCNAMGLPMKCPREPDFRICRVTGNSLGSQVIA